MSVSPTYGSTGPQINKAIGLQSLTASQLGPISDTPKEQEIDPVKEDIQTINLFTKVAEISAREQ